jgi:hypothetical protein
MQEPRCKIEGGIGLGACFLALLFLKAFTFLASTGRISPAKLQEISAGSGQSAAARSE